MRFALFIAGALLATAAHAGGLHGYLAKAELAPKSKPGAALPFSFKADAGADATLEIPLDERGAAFTENPGPYLLRLQPKGDVQLQVRQRSVIYLNLSDEGPHIALPALERRGPWQAAHPRTPQQFDVGGLKAPQLAFTRAQLLAAVRRSEVGSAAGNDPETQARWIALARQCRHADDGPCYTVVDSEFEVTIRRQGRVLARGILRLRQPNGC